MTIDILKCQDVSENINNDHSRRADHKNPLFGYA